MCRSTLHVMKSERAERQTWNNPSRSCLIYLDSMHNSPKSAKSIKISYVMLCQPVRVRWWSVAGWVLHLHRPLHCRRSSASSGFPFGFADWRVKPKRQSDGLWCQPLFIRGFSFSVKPLQTARSPEFPRGHFEPRWTNDVSSESSPIDCGLRCIEIGKFRNE